MGWGYYESRGPREVRGGIRAQSTRGNFGETWWAKRWMTVLDEFGLGARLSRGRSYARGGQVASIKIEPGSVTAKVQGSQPRPYKVSIGVEPLPPEEWDRVVEAMAMRPMLAARLLSGVMPNDIETVFESSGLSLFPASSSELDTNCSCPDWSNPCKHVAAVYCLLGEEFDRDPFLLFRLRGMTRDALLKRLTGAAPGADEEPEEPATPEPLEIAQFWSGAGSPVPSMQDVRTPPVTAPLLRRLGAFPFWRDVIPLRDALEPVYARAGEQGLEIFTGGREQGPTCRP